MRDEHVTLLWAYEIWRRAYVNVANPGGDPGIQTAKFQDHSMYKNMIEALDSAQAHGSAPTSTDRDLTETEQPVSVAMKMQAEHDRLVDRVAWLQEKVDALETDEQPDQTDHELWGVVHRLMSRVTRVEDRLQDIANWVHELNTNVDELIAWKAELKGESE